MEIGDFDMLYGVFLFPVVSIMHCDWKHNNNHNNETINRNDAYIPSAAGIWDMTVAMKYLIMNTFTHTQILFDTAKVQQKFL